MRTGRICMGAVLAILLLCAAGPGSAAAVTKLCSTNVTTCSSPYPAGTKLTLELKSAVSLFSTSPNIAECTKSKLFGELTAAAPAVGEIQEVEFQGCTGCKFVWGEHLHWTAKFEATSKGNGTMTLSAGSSTKPGFRLEQCGSNFQCFYEASALKLSVTGGTPAIISASAVPLPLTTAFMATCGTTLSWTAEYKVASPNPLFVTN
jgi:hypothetical protein